MLENPPQASPVSTAGRLKYADPRSLPSFPSHGLSPNGAAASAAATLGWANQKPIEPWKPDESSSAFAAAVLAKNYKMTPAWEPTSNSDGAKAALLAVGSADAALRRAKSARVPKTTQDGWGNSAATQAFHAPSATSPRQVNLSHGNSAATQAFAVNRSLSMRKSNVSDTVEDGKSLAAAKGAMSLARPRAISSPSHPAPSRESQPAVSNALSGATSAHRASMKARAPGKDLGAVPVTTMTRNMYTSHPMVQPEVDEQQRNQELHQTAVAMAKKMYSQQQKSIEQAKDSNPDDKGAAPSTYMSLQDAAYKQAQERLAKLHDEHLKNREYQEYYGNTQTPKRRFSMAAKLRRRSSSDSDMNDKEQSQRIRQQMSMFSSKLSQVDSSKRDKDREALLAAAQRNVKARLQGMDEKVYMETGKVNPTMLSDWDVKAQQAAQSRHDVRSEHKGKLDLGGGKFMDPEEVNAIASKKVQPVLDDINEKAEAERARLALLKLEEEAKKAEEERQRARDREFKEINRKTKEEDRQEERAKKQQDKNEEKERKNEEKAAKAEQKKVAKEEKRRSRRDTFRSILHHDRHEREDGTVDGDNAEPDLYSADDSHQQPTTIETEAETGATGQSKVTEESSSPTSPTSKMKGWIKNRFSRARSVGEPSDKKKGFLGGVALRQEANGSSASLDNRASSMRDVAMAGRSNPDIVVDSRGVSPMGSNSSDSTEHYDDYADASMTLPRPLEDPAIRTSSSPSRDSRFREMMDR